MTCPAGWPAKQLQIRAVVGPGLPALPARARNPGIAVLDSRIYVLGGRHTTGAGSRTGYVHIYDAGKDSWVGRRVDNSISGLAACVLTLPRSLLLEPPGDPWTAQADPDFASEVMSVSDWEEFDNSSGRTRFPAAGEWRSQVSPTPARRQVGAGVLGARRPVAGTLWGGPSPGQPPSLSSSAGVKAPAPLSALVTAWG